MDISIGSQSTRYCKNCNYEAKDQNDRDEHLDIEHTSPSYEGDEHTFFYCNCCEKTLENKSDLMHHKKVTHSEKVSSCWHFAAGSCDFGENAGLSTAL